MKLEIVEYLRCPTCQGELALKADRHTDAKVLSGQLLCQECNRGYEIADGFSNLVYPEAKELPKIDAEFLKHRPSNKPPLT